MQLLLPWFCVSFPSGVPQFSLLFFAFLEQIVCLSNRHYALLSVERIVTLVTYYCSTLLTVTVILSIILTGKLFSWSLNSTKRTCSSRTGYTMEFFFFLFVTFGV